MSLCLGTISTPILTPTRHDTDSTELRLDYTLNMALPLSFSNSFFTPDLRNGVEVLWAKLQAGVHENEEILRFIGVSDNQQSSVGSAMLSLVASQDRASASSAAARALRDSAESQFRANGFAKDDGASLRRTFEGACAVWERPTSPVR